MKFDYYCSTGAITMKVGNYRLPDLDIEGAIAAAKLLEQNTLGKEVTRDAFAKALGHSTKSGTFFVKMADLRLYGLIEGRNERYKTTALAQRIAYPQMGDDDAYKAAINELIMNVPLYKALREHLGEILEPSETQFSIALQQITDEHPEKLKKESERLRRIYVDIMNRYEVTTMYEPGQLRAPPQHQTSERGIQPEGGVIKLYYGDKTKLELEDTVENMKVIVTLLENRIKRIEQELKKTPTEEKSIDT